MSEARRFRRCTGTGPPWPEPRRARKLLDGDLLVELVLGAPAPNGGLDREQLRIVLEYDGQRFVGPGTSGWFEDELLSIQNQLPDDAFIKACINCLYSDYSPYGHGLFGCMMCRSCGRAALGPRTALFLVDPPKSPAIMPAGVNPALL